MSEEKSLVLHQNPAYIAPIVDVASAMVRFQAMKDFIAHGLRENTDFGIIPGTNKPTLLKPGAEKLSNFFGLAPKFEIVEKELDWTGAEHGGEPFFYFHYRCRMLRGDVLAAEGEGSANSFEKKYRWRSSERVCPQCGKPTIITGKKEYGGGFVCFTKKGGCGAKFSDNAPEIINQPLGQVKNPDIADVVNTLQKMAQKRAYVAAVLLAVNGSEYFTQDVEDFIDAPYTIEPPTAIVEQRPTPQPTNGKAQSPIANRVVQPEPEQPPANAEVVYPDELLTAIGKQYELHPARVKSTLKYSNLPVDCSTGAAMTWMATYKANRDAGMTPQEAAAAANG